MDKLPPEMLPAVPHVVFLIFNLSIPGIIAWGVVIAAIFFAAWARLPKIF